MDMSMALPIPQREGSAMLVNEGVPACKKPSAFPVS